MLNFPEEKNEFCPLTFVAYLCPFREETEEDEEELLYGESSKPPKPTSAPKSAPAASADAPSFHAASSPNPAPPTAKEPTHWALIARDNGYLEIYSMPDFQHSFLVKDFSLKPRVLIDFDLAGDEK